MKPRLKLMLDGTLRVVMPGPRVWTAFDARQVLRITYGSIRNFSIRFHLDYQAVCAALHDDFNAGRRAGKTSQIRQILGLASDPTPISIRLSAVHCSARRGLNAQVRAGSRA